MSHGNNPWRFASVNRSKVCLEPLQLLVRAGNLPLVTVNLTEGTRVSNISLGFSRLSITVVTNERPFWGVGEIRLTINGYEVSKAVVERIPEVANTIRLWTRHAETVLVSSKVPVWCT